MSPRLPEWMWVALAIALASPARAGDGLEELSLEELLEVEVVTASKRPTSAFETPAAVTVLTQDDLRRYGAVTLVDALEWVPGVQFSRLNAANTAVGVRGFNGVLSDKLLVLIDGRSVYSLFFSGVYWDEHDLPIDDIDRIEIVRGPGGALWGANAVNGVINVVTREAGETQGWSVSSRVSGDEFGARARFGGRVGDEGHGRVWISGHDRGEFDAAPGQFDGGGWRNLSTGLRYDAPAGGGRVTLNARAYRVETERQDVLFDEERQVDVVRDVDLHLTQAVSALARWVRPVGNRSSVAVQSWLEFHDRDERLFHEERFSYDADLQFTREGDRHDFVTGANLRVSDDRIRGSSTYGFVPTSRTLHWTSLFVQDEFRATDRVRLIAGTKLEHNDDSGWEWQPSVRTAFDTGRAGFFWAAASRAVRTPSRALTSTVARRQVGPGQGELVSTIANFEGDPGLDAESMLAYEMGWRKQLGSAVGIDLAVFQQDYDDLVYNVVEQPEVAGGIDVPPHLELDSEVVNGAEMRARGVETVLEVRPRPWIRLQASYTYLDLDLLAAPMDPEQGDVAVSFFNNNPEDSPRHMGFLRLGVAPTSTWSADLGLRVSSALDDVSEDQAVYRLPIEGVQELQARLAWRPDPAVEVSVLGRNLIDDGRVDLEDRTDIYPSAEIPRQVFLQLSVQR